MRNGCRVQKFSLFDSKDSKCETLEYVLNEVIESAPLAPLAKN
ncbi:hypothetical protein [Helicobacter cinaedi]|nr:hypothetical protein [Helicobacter cinaedi]